MNARADTRHDEFAWKVQPEAASLVQRQLTQLATDSPAVVKLASRLLNETGTRLVDWIDHLVIPASAANGSMDLAAAGFESDEADVTTGQVAWRHSGGMFPAIVVDDGASTSPTPRRLAIKVDSVDDFVTAQRLGDAHIAGEAGGQFRAVVFADEGDVELMAVERHGYRGFAPVENSSQQISAAAEHQTIFESRQREFDNRSDGFQQARELIAAAIDDLGVDWTCDLFCATERHYWQAKNRAGQVQKARQDALGIGWGNHDHHTYRSSRIHFRELIATLELLGFDCRERFYAGEEAGWGAQVLEQPTCGIAIFADVDLTPEELADDFAHEPLAAEEQLGTIGLWCTLHGEAFLEAGLHHLECQFDFNAVREQLASEGIETMAPFTDMPYLKQAFTVGETWPVQPRHLQQALAEGSIDADQADQFRAAGAIGSHLEVLERNDGFKGFNQTGISQIIRKTDPRA